MASTTLMPLDPAMSPQRVSRILSISANLLPEEIAAGRRARRSRSWIMVALVVVLALLGGWYANAVHSYNTANDALGAVTKTATDLQKDQTKYNKVVTIQNETNAISAELKRLLANDLPYATLLDTLRSTGTSSGATVTGISALLSDGTNANSADTLPSKSGTAVGSVILTGTAPDKPSVAKYVEALGKLTIVSNPYLTNASKGDKNTWDFTIRIDIAPSILCGRFTDKCKNTGGN
jgi:hypothetical protein